MQNLRAWLENVDAFCGSVLREPVSGLHKMDLTSALRRSKHVLKTPTGRGQKIDQLAAHLAETAEAVRLQIWDAPDALRGQYLEGLRKMVEKLRREVVALIAQIEIAEIEGTQEDSISSPLPGQPLSLSGPVEMTTKTAAGSASARSDVPSSRRSSSAGSARITGITFLWTGFTKGLGKVVRHQ